MKKKTTNALTEEVMPIEEDGGVEEVDALGGLGIIEAAIAEEDRDVPCPEPDGSIRCAIVACNDDDGAPTRAVANDGVGRAAVVED